MTSTVEVAAGDDIDVERSLFNSSLGSASSRRDKPVPVIDMSQADEAIKKQMVDAAQSIGFFTVVNHGIPQDLVDSVFQVSAEFVNQSIADKRQQSPFASHLNSGFEFMSQVRPSTGTADQKETIQITVRKEAMDNRWPKTPATFEPDTKMLMEEALILAKRIMTLLQEAVCPELDPPGLIADSHELWGVDGQCTLRLLHYPPISKDTPAGLITPDGEGRIHWRAGPHTDWCNVTLLFQKQAGLECCASPRVATEDAYWTPVDPIQNQEQFCEVILAVCSLIFFFLLGSLGWPLEGAPVSPAIFPVAILAFAGVLGGSLYFGKVEGLLSSCFSSVAKAQSILTAAGALSITVAHGHSMAYNSNARKLFNVPHPCDSDDIGFLNAARGYYNLVEQFPFVLFNYVLAREGSPCTAGLLLSICGIGRVLYTQKYASEGPKGRISGFMIATFSSTACLGLGLYNNILA